MLHAVIDQYLAQYAKRFSLRSVEVKAYSLSQFVGYLVIKKISSWDLCDQKLIRDYIIYRSKVIPDGAKSKLSTTSMQTQLASIRVFLDYLVEMNIISYNPAKLVKSPKSDRNLPDVLEIDLLKRILDYNPQDEYEVRDLAICELFYSSGLRLSELTDLNCNDVDLEEREALVFEGKGDKDRIVPIGSKAVEAISRWLILREEWLLFDPQKKPCHALFITKRWNRLCSRQISNRVKNYALKSGVNINLYPHLLRHSMATHILESSQDIRLVQELLGHADISTTQIYTHLDFGHLTKVFDETHPRAKKKPDS